MKAAFDRRRFDALLPWAVPALVLIVWQALGSAGVIPSRILPTPWAVLEAGYQLARQGTLLESVAVSTQRALLGFAIGGGIGFALGLLNGVVPLAEKLIDSTVQMVRNIPHLALIPLVILWFGIEEEAKLFLVALGVAFPIYLNTFPLGIMWVTLIVAETISASSGIGYMAMNAREFMQMDVVVLSIVMYALLGKLSDWIARLLERTWLRWHPNYRNI